MSGHSTDPDHSGAPRGRSGRTAGIVLTIIALIGALVVIWTTESPLALVLLLPALLVLVRTLVGVRSPE